MRIQIQTYQELRQYVDLFASGTLEILIVQGSPGTGKTSLVREVFKDTPPSEYAWIEGRMTAPKLYELLYHYRDCPVIFDDADSVYTDKQSITLLKQLCQTSKDKSVSWATMRTLPQDMPERFYTGSTVLIICNEWKSQNKHISSIEDRGILLTFNPSKAEIHKYATQIYHDQEVLAFFAQYLNAIKILSLRQYKVCIDIKNSLQSGSTTYTDILHMGTRSDEERDATHQHPNGYTRDGHQSTPEQEYMRVRDSLQESRTGNMPCHTLHWKDIAVSSWGLTQDETIVLQLLQDQTYSTHTQRAEEYHNRTGRSSRSFWRAIRDFSTSV